MRARLAVLAAAAIASLAIAHASSATLIVGRNPQSPTLQVDSAGHALMTFSSGGAVQHILVWGP